jgi:hypothetical protein
MFYSIQHELLPGMIQYAQDIVYENRQDMEPGACIAIDSSWAIIAMQERTLLMRLIADRRELPMLKLP